MILGAIVLSLSIPCADPGLNIDEAKPKLAVMRLQPKQLPRETVEILDELLIKSIADRGLFEVIAAEELNAVLSFEKQKELAGCDDVTCMAEIGNALGAKQLLMGSIGKLGSKIKVTLKLVDMETFAIERAQSEAQNDEDIYEQAINEALTRLFGHGTIGISTHPQGATVTVDGRNLGVSPLTTDRLPARRHLVSVSQDGYESEQVYLLLHKNEAKNLDLTLRQLSGTISITTHPPGATCYLDNEPFGESPCEKGGVAVGEHSLQVQREHYLTEKSTITVKHRENERWNVELLPLAVPVTIGTTPQGAQVLVNGELLGNSEHKTKLDPGPHQVEVELDGYKNFRESFVVEAGKPKTLNLTLTPGISDGEQFTHNVKMAAKWTLTGLAAAATVVWAWQGLRANSLEEDARSHHISSQEFKDAKSSGQTAAAVADVSLGTAILAAGGATYFWLTMEF